MMVIFVLKMFPQPYLFAKPSSGTISNFKMAPTKEILLHPHKPLPKWGNSWVSIGLKIMSYVLDTCYAPILATLPPQ
jgi:hypothetical protein